MSNKKTSEKMERDFHASRSRVYKKTSKPVEWNGRVFRSRSHLKDFLGVANSQVARAIKEQRPIKGHIPKDVSKGHPCQK